MSELTPYREPSAEKWQSIIAEIEQQVYEYFFPVPIAPPPDNRHLSIIAGIW